MNTPSPTPSPLIPQGTTAPRGNSSFYIKFLMIVTVHVVVIGGMLLQGCKDTSAKDSTSNSSTADNGVVATPVSPAPTGQPSMDNPPPLPVAGNSATLPAGPAIPSATLPTPSLPSADLPKNPEIAPLSGTGQKEYVIAEGDRLGSIAKKNGVSLKALEDANPGINPVKLQINQKIMIPAAVASTSTSTGHHAGLSAAAETDIASGDSSVYKVKSGDVLLRIAKNHGTTVRKIMAMNDLKTTSIHVGQVLKMPAGGMAPAMVPAIAPAVAPAATPAGAPPVTRASAAAPSVASN